MDNYLLQVIKQTTDYIENNLLETLTLDNIAENVNMSKFHLLRIWKGSTLTGLMEYVRRRRTALSLGDLLNNHYSIDFIASKFSFGCERTFNRVFKSEYDTTPAKWRRKPTPLKILDRFNPDFMNCTGNSLVFYRSTTVLPAFEIAGPEYVINGEDNRMNQTANKAGIDFFYNDRPKFINPVEKDIYIGFTTIPEGACNHSLYQPSLQINENSIVPPGMKVKRVTPHKYGVFTYMGLHSPEEISSETLYGIWKFVFETWMPTVQFNLKERFSFEYINYAKCNRHYCECDLYFPISYL